MPKVPADARRHVPIATALIAVATLVTSQLAHADSLCQSITAPVLEIEVVDCTQAQVWSQLKASGQFPDVFAGAGKMTTVCYMSTGPAAAFIGSVQLTIESSLSGWTTDFRPVLFGGTDNLGTVVTQLTIADLQGHPVSKLFTRDTLDLSQITTTGTAPEEDVIVGGTVALHGASGTYRIESTPEDPNATKVKLTNLSGVICLGGR